jgi:hypothetical protein
MSNVQSKPLKLKDTRNGEDCYLIREHVVEFGPVSFPHAATRVLLVSGQERQYDLTPEQFYFLMTGAEQQLQAADRIVYSKYIDHKADQAPPLQFQPAKRPSFKEQLQAEARAAADQVKREEELVKSGVASGIRQARHFVETKRDTFRQGSDRFKLFTTLANDLLTLELNSGK